MNFHRMGRLLAVVAALLSAVVLSACGSSNDSNSGSSMGNGHTNDHGMSAGSGKEVAGLGNGTDLAFVSQMIPHHQSAIGMAKIAQDRTQRPEIRSLAGDIISAQQDELGRLGALKTQLTDGGVKPGSLGLDEQHMGMSMDISKLKAANPFDREFLDMMTPHHQGAVAMAKIELAKGQNADAKQLATGIISAQEREIAQMASWRKSWFGSASASMGG